MRICSPVVGTSLVTSSYSFCCSSSASTSLRQSASVMSVLAAIVSTYRFSSALNASSVTGVAVGAGVLVGATVPSGCGVGGALGSGVLVGNGVGVSR